SRRPRAQSRWRSSEQAWGSRCTRRSMIASRHPFASARSSTMRLLVRIVVASLLLSATTTVFAQTFTGSVSGVVKDQQGGVLPGVSVTLTGKTGTRTTTSDAGGNYRFPAVEPGTYAVSAELSGFKSARQENVSVTVGSALDVPLGMTVAGVAESVNVVATSPVVDVKSSSTQTEVSQDLLYNAPITRTAIN